MRLSFKPNVTCRPTRNLWFVNVFSTFRRPNSVVKNWKFVGDPLATGPPSHGTTGTVGNADVLSSLIEANALTATPYHQTTTTCLPVAWKDSSPNLPIRNCVKWVIKHYPLIPPRSETEHSSCRPNADVRLYRMRTTRATHLQGRLRGIYEGTMYGALARCDGQYIGK